MRRGVIVVVVLVLTAAVWLGHQAHTGAKADLGQMQWLPTESHPGGAQYDPRLDRQVSFWGAGIVLPDVFGSIKTQTGVEIGFWPPGDENERVRVNLFLNPEDPPALRDLMAQLSWVLGCAFSYERAEEADPRYCLLSTNIRFGVKRRLRAEQEEAERRRAAVMWRRQAELREQTAEKLEELQDGLALSREDAVER